MMVLSGLRNKDLLAGVFFIGIALSYVILGRDLEIGTMTNMGPGYFPYAVSGILALLGIIVIVDAVRKDESEKASPPLIMWRPLIIIIGAPVVFALLIEHFGFIPSLLTSIWFSTLAARPWHFWKSLGLSVAIVFFCWLVFVVAFGVPIPIAKFPG